MEIYGNSSTEVVREAITRVREEGRRTNRWGGTIPAKLGVGAPGNRPREMVEIPYLMVELSDPHKNWTDIGQQTMITFRETEDHLQGDNPGRVILHSKMYREWLNADGKLPLTYGERLTSYPVGGGTYIDQLLKMEERLKENPSTRKACAAMWYPDFDQRVELPACNIFFQATVVDGKLDWTTLNRSLDLFHGLTENIFMFSTWQQELATKLGIPVGVYRTISSNAHFYVDDKPKMDLDMDDPYETIPALFPEKSVEWVLEDFQTVDKYLDANEYQKAFETMKQIALKDAYWGKFKAAGVADWFILKKDQFMAETAVQFMGVAPWRDNIRRRIKEWKVPSAGMTT